MDKEFLKETLEELRHLRHDNEKLEINLNVYKRKLAEKEAEFEGHIEDVKRSNAIFCETKEENRMLIGILKKELLLKSKKIKELENKIKELEKGD